MTSFGSRAFEAQPDGGGRLIERARGRDPEVWAAWHDQYFPLIYRYAYSRLRSPHEAEDLASQTFLEAMRSIHRYSERGKPVLAWLYGIARHLVSKRLRELAREQRASDGWSEQWATRPSEDSSLERLVVRDALERLKPEHREVLVLRFVLALPSKQVAGLLGKSEAATYSLQVRAITALKRALSGKNAEIFPRTE